MCNTPDLDDPFVDAIQRGLLTNGGYQDGRLVDLREAPDVELILVGDIHALYQRISLILESTGLEQRLAEGSAVLVFLGDLHHSEDRELAGEMDSSVETFRAFMKLKLAYPKHVYALLGNHEFTRTRSTKRGYYQGDLFREALEEQGLYETYLQFLKTAPLVVLHQLCVGVHAGPARSIGTLDELRELKFEDVATEELPVAVRELCFSRHVDWSPNPEKHYYDHHVADFLKLCGVPEARLVTGHTPLHRAADWRWEIGKHLTVIFAAGRELGYYRAINNEEQFVRLGRFTDGRFREDRSEDVETLTWAFEKGCRFVQITDQEFELSLLPDVEYRLHYPQSPLQLEFDGNALVKICHYRHLTAWAQSYYSMGFYLVGDEYRQQVLQMKTDLATLIGGEELSEGVRFSWGSEELAIVRRIEDDLFSLRPLVEGLRLRT